MITDETVTAPKVIRIRPISLRAFRVNGDRLGADLVDGINLVLLIQRFFDNPDVTLPACPLCQARLLRHPDHLGSSSDRSLYARISIRWIDYKTGRFKLGAMKILLGAILLVLPVQLAAQTVDPTENLPEPASISVPDVTPSHDANVRNQGYKFYYFHNSAVTFAEAYQDLKECRAHLVVGGGVPVPSFVPWDDAHGDEGHARKIPVAVPMYGVVGAAMAAIILPKMERGVAGNKVLRCMTTRGYQRYAIPQASWDILNYGDEQKLLLMQAKLASGSKPQDEPVVL